MTPSRAHFPWIDGWHELCVTDQRENTTMFDSTFELPLAFDGHAAHLVVTHLPNGRWSVRTEVDGRVLGSEQFAMRPQVDRFRARMQDWLSQVEASERRDARLACV